MHEELRTNVEASLYICVSVVVGWLVCTFQISDRVVEEFCRCRVLSDVSVTFCVVL